MLKSFGIVLGLIVATVCGTSVFSEVKKDAPKVAETVIAANMDALESPTSPGAVYLPIKK